MYGLGSIFGKTVRDSRRSTIIVAGFLTLLVLILGSSTAATFATVEARAEVAVLTRTLPAIILGLYGGTQPSVETLGGLMNWRYGLVFFVLPGFWSLLALSSTLVVEARRGSLDFVGATPLSRRRIALEKLGGHIALCSSQWRSWLSLSGWPTVFATLPGDGIPLGAAVSYVTLLGLIGLATGAIAFALAPFVGRGAAAGIAGAIMFGSWIVYGYRESIAVFDTLTPLTWYSWTADHRPIAGVYDWPPLLTLVGIIIAGGVIGTLAFDRRDLGATGSVRMPRMPQVLIGIGGPAARSFGERMVGALGWGIGLAVYALTIAASGDSLRQSMVENQTMVGLFRALFPNIDLNAPGLGLQLAFLFLGYLGTALAAATIVGGWGSDESEGRLDFLLATPVARSRWFVWSGLGAYVAIGLVAVVVAIGIALGVMSTGDDPLTPALGTAALVLYGSAVAGIGLAVGGLVRSSFAASAAVVVAVGTILIDILVPALRLPDWVHDFALTAHFGQPMLGDWDPVGIVASLVLAIGGLAIGAWGFARRDLQS
jgi:ABC-2 type transport system permease protein